MNLEGKKINFIGDSITFGHGVDDENDTFVKRIERNEKLAASRNYGISGTRIAKQTVPSEDPKFDRYFASRIDEMDPDADIIVIFGGTNDFGHGDASFGTFDDRSIYTFYGALHDLYTKMIEKYPEAAIVVMTPLHRLFELDTVGDGRKTNAVPLKGYVEAIREVAEYYGLPVLDLYKNCTMNPVIEVIREKYIPDGLHPNAEGHRVLSEKIAAFLKTL